MDTNEPRIIDSDTVIDGMVTTSVFIEDGATAHVRGIVAGSVTVATGSTLIITATGSVAGTLTMQSGAKVFVDGDMMGTIAILRGAEFVVNQRGRQGGTVRNDGSYVNHGVRGGVTGGSASIVDSETGTILEGRRDGNDVHLTWPSR